jgi:HAE1 family hydrophobic/amphiphilic exporter-1
MLLRPKKRGTGLLQKFFDGFNRVFGRATNGYVGTCRFLIRKSVVAVVLLVALTVGTALIGRMIPTSFLPEEDQGYFFAQVVLPDAASLERTDGVMREAEEIFRSTPGVQYITAINGLNFLS